MSAPELVKALCDHAQPGSQVHEEIKGALSVVLTKNLTDSIDRHEKAATRLANQLLWLKHSRSWGQSSPSFHLLSNRDGGAGTG
jgi:hypothetical protein